MSTNASQPGSDAPGATLQPGTKLGHYRITEQLGAGGTSIVYQGHDDLINRKVAIKQIRLTGEPDDDALRRQVKSEAHMQKQAAAADPQRLVQLIEVIDDSRGLFLVSEFVEGTSLEQELAQHTEPMELKRAIGILAATAQALAGIHQRGIIHRDLKPGNILLPREGGLKIADFGLATALSEQQLMSLGSVRYMAPELLRGEDADVRADLYALGIISYEMLAGRRQFEQAFRMVLRDQRNQAMRWVKWHTNLRAKVSPIRELRSEVPDAVGELVDRLMDKDPDRRVPTAGDVVEAIRRHYAGQAPASPAGDAGATAGPPPAAGAAEPALTGGGDTAPLPKRSRAPLALAGVLIFLLLAAGGLGAYLLQQRNAAETERRQQANEQLESARSAYRQGDFDAARQAYAQVADNWPDDSDVGRSARAGVLLARGRHQLNNEQYQQARQDFEQLQALNTTAQRQGEPLLVNRDQVQRLLNEAENRGAFAQAMDEIGQLIEQNKFNEARDRLREWQELTLTGAEQERLRELSTRFEDQKARYERQQVLADANNLVEQGRREEALTMLEDALEQSPSPRLQQRYDELAAEQTYQDALASAKAAEAAGNLEKAIAAYERAQNVREKDEIAQKLSELQSRAALEEGLSLLEQGNTAQAEAALTRSLRYQDNERAREALERIESTSQRRSFVRDGDEAFSAGNYEAAIQQYRNALKLGGSDDVQQKLERARMRHMVQRGLEAIRADELEKAQNLLEQAQQMDASSAEIQQAMRKLEVHKQYHQHLSAGDRARERSDFRRAKTQYAEAQKILDTEEVRQRLDTAEYADAIAKTRAYISMDEFDSARAWLENAAKIRDSDEVQNLRQQIEQESGAS